MAGIDDDGKIGLAFQDGYGRDIQCEPRGMLEGSYTPFTQQDIPVSSLGDMFHGGEEFIVIWAHTSKDDAMTAAERVRLRVASHPYANRESQPLGVVSLSGGVATFPDDGRTGAELIKAADAALYEAKRDGRNRVYRTKPKYFSDEQDGELSDVKSG